MDDKKQETNVDKYRQWHLAAAEMIDAWRIFPRLIVAGYATLIGYVVIKFAKFDYIEKVDCTASVMQVLLDKNISIDRATEIACNVTDIIGPPDSITTILGILVGASAAVFGLYVNSGKKWNGFTFWSKKKEEANSSDQG